MKKMTVWTTYLRSRLVSSSGRIKQHRRAGRADEAGQNAADGEERRVGHRMRPKIAGDPNPAADRVQGEQQHDERDVLVEHRVGQDGPRLRPVQRRRPTGSTT